MLLATICLPHLLIQEFHDGTSLLSMHFIVILLGFTSNHIFSRNSFRDTNDNFYSTPISSIKKDLEKIGSIDEEIEALKKKCDLSLEQANNLANELSKKKLKYFLQRVKQDV